MTNPPDPKKIEPAPPAESPPKKEATAEEQMAAYEEDLKENDWGHQPC